MSSYKLYICYHNLRCIALTPVEDGDYYADCYLYFGRLANITKLTELRKHLFDVDILRMINLAQEAYSNSIHTALLCLELALLLIFLII